MVETNQSQGDADDRPFDKQLLGLFQHASSDPLEPGQSAELLSYTWYQALMLIANKLMALEKRIEDINGEKS
ncbi:MAG: hypothetical protein E3J72_16970 [Planctomycetota bacterium]|nr:MAG: hypothetical protein E3J72_16970 [Planctomycetota bacterium]